jgi:hypothetical protein
MWLCFCPERPEALRSEYQGCQEFKKNVVPIFANLVEDPKKKQKTCVEAYMILYANKLMLI